MSFYQWFAERRITGLGAKRRRRAERLKMRLLRPHLTEKPRVLEIGPGTGWFAAECSAAGFDYEGIEPSEPLRRELLEAGLDVVDGMTPPIPKPDGRFDLVYADQVLEHFTDHARALEFVRECARVLAPGGLLCLIAPNYLTQREFFFEIDYTHGYPTTERRMVQLTTDAGLEPLRTVRNIGPAVGPLRWLQTFAGWILGWRPMGVPFALLGLDGLLHSLRKNLFETIILIARKAENQPQRGF